MLLLDTFKETIFLKETSDLQEQYNALKKLEKEFPDNYLIQEKLYYVEKGLKGEEEIAYRLKKSNIGMYVLHDINLEYEGLKAQVDYIIFTKANCYFIECKNLIGNIIVNEKGDFIREYTYKGNKVRKGMPSPLRQVEDQREVFKKIWMNTPGENKLVLFLRKTIWDKYFTQLYRVLAVAANPETILDVKYAPKEIKYKVIRADRLINQIQYDIEHSNRDEWENKKKIKAHAERFLSFNHNKNIDYYEYYKEKCIKNVDSDGIITDDELRTKLIEFRQKRSDEMKLPLSYIFTDIELDKLIELKPKSINELNMILTPQKKIETHGEEIIKQIISK